MHAVVPVATITAMIEQLKKDVQALVQAGGRLVGSAGHAAAREYLIRRMTELEVKPCDSASFEWPYEVADTRFVNVLGRVPGSEAGLPPMVVTAHYDTCGPYPGADDNAAAMAIALAVVDPLRTRGLKRDVILGFFDAEEPPHFVSPAMGSVHWYTHQRQGAVHCAVALDLVGHDVPLPGLEDIVAITGMESDPELAETLRACEPDEDIRLVPTLNRYIGDLSDHHVFRVHQRPYLFLTCARWEHYHAPTDTPEKLNYKKMAAIARFLVDLLADLDTRALDGPFEGYDSTETELRFLRKAIGPITESLGLSLESRADIDLVTHLLVAQFGL